MDLLDARARACCDTLSLSHFLLNWPPNGPTGTTVAAACKNAKLRVRMLISDSYVDISRSNLAAVLCKEEKEKKKT